MFLTHHIFPGCIHHTSGYIAPLNGRVTELAECTGLENRRRETYRGFESHPFRQLNAPLIAAGQTAKERWLSG